MPSEHLTVAWSLSDLDHMEQRHLNVIVIMPVSLLSGVRIQPLISTVALSS